jgi:hypothetical protein
MQIWQLICSHSPLMVEYTSHAQPVNNTCNIDPLGITLFLSQRAFTNNKKAEREVGLNRVNTISMIQTKYSKTWLIWKSRDRKKVYWIMKNLYNSVFFLLANILLEKFVLLLLVRYAVAYYAVAVTHYCFTLCSVVINVTFNTVKPLSIISERTMKNKQWMPENNVCGEVIYFELFEKNCTDFSFELWIIMVLKISR